MTRTKRIILALRHTGEAADSAQLAICGEEISTPRNNLMGISLMTYIPHQLIVWQIKDIVQRNRKFNCAEARSQMPRIFGALLDDITTQLGTILHQLLRGELLQILRRIYLIEQIVCHLFH